MEQRTAKFDKRLAGTFFFGLTALCDGLAVWSAFVMALALKRWMANNGWIPPGPIFDDRWYDLFGMNTLHPSLSSGLRDWRYVVPGSMLGVYFSFKYFGLYVERRFFTPISMFGRILTAILIYFILLAAVLYLTKLMISRWVLFFFGMLAVFFVVLERAIILRIRHVLRKRRICDTLNVMVVGSSDAARELIARNADKPELGYVMKGYVAEEENPELAARYLGPPDAVREAAAREDVQVIFYARPSSPVAEMMELITSCRELDIDVRAIHPKCNIIVFRVNHFFDAIHGMPIVDFGTGRITWWRRFIKRSLDVAGALFGIVAFSWLWAFVAFAVKLSSRGPVFFRQTRVTESERPFEFLKFRSMRVGSHETDTHREYMRTLIEGESDVSTEIKGKKFNKIVGDNRVTWFGSIIRRYSIDEFPQLWNVLVGDMSLVGPRPPIPYEVEMYKPWHKKRLNGRGGITGLWQISGRNELTFDEQVMLDIYYLRNHSLFLDYSILLKTFFVIFGWQSGF